MSLEEVLDRLYAADQSQVFLRSYCLSDGCYRRVDVRGKAGYAVESQAEDKAIRGRNLSADLVAGMAGQSTCP